MSIYKKELDAIKKVNRFRERKLYKKKLIDMASNDYLGIGSKKKLFKKAYKRVKRSKRFAPKASLLVNGYSKIHKKFENYLCKLNNFESGIVVGSGFLANIALIESLVRKNDIIFIDEDYHASGIVGSKLTSGKVIFFKHNDYEDLEEKIYKYSIKSTNRIFIAIEGIYSMGGDIAKKEFDTIAKKYNAILIVDEAHSSGVIGKNLLGWFDYHSIDIEPYHIKMGTLGKAYGSYGAYILASGEIISFLENRAKSIIYTTAPSIFDIAYAHTNLKYIQKHKKKFKNRIKKFHKVVKKYFDIDIEALILAIDIGDNKKVLELQKTLLEKDILVGAIRTPTVKKAILRVILNLNVDKKVIKKIYENTL